MSENPKNGNRLRFEKSPYLLQHAYNPVDWYPWGEEAFQRAKQEDKPIFLSIGYATCHWCHVMEKESFENNEIARLLNDSFINIKVDREEMPEIDSLYMEFAQSLMSGSAGWPLNLILTPELKPFFAATYLPPHAKPGMIGLDQLVERIKEVWTSEEKERVIDQAGRIVDLFSSQVHTQGDVIPGPEVVKYLAELLYKLADPVYGGLKGSPKFPIGYQQSFLIQNNSDSRSIFLAERTLDMMARGGIYDHLGGGFSRYSVDEEWFQPHFEKMLYDNALLMDAYLDGYLRTKKPLYKRIAKEIADYLIRDMSHPNGGFYSAEDADSEGEEGKYYTWTKDELVDILGEKGADIFSAYYNVSGSGNFEGRNILQIKLREPEFAKKHLLDEKDVEDILAEEKRLLMQVRDKRIRPLKDDKILSSWNGLAIYSMVNLGFALGEDKYLNSARQAAQFIKKNLWIDGELYRRFREGADYKAGLDEYAFMIRAAIKLFECDMGSEYLRFALEMNHILESKFKIDGGAYFQTDGDDPNLLIRKCHFSDGAEPSGNAIQTENLLKLFQITGNPILLGQAEDIFKAVKKYLDNYPPGYCYHIMNIKRYFDKDAPVYIFAMNTADNNLTKIKSLLANQFNPHRTIVFVREDDQILKNICPHLSHYKPINGKTTLYLCRQGVCQAPENDMKVIETILKH